MPLITCTFLKEVKRDERVVLKLVYALRSYYLLRWRYKPFCCLFYALSGQEYVALNLLGRKDEARRVKEGTECQDWQAYASRNSQSYEERIYNHICVLIFLFY